MKRRLAILLLAALVSIFGAAACAGGEEGGEKQKEDQEGEIEGGATYQEGEIEPEDMKEGDIMVIDEEDRQETQGEEGEYYVDDDQP
ncbi:MAG: hypothetical protein H0U89_00210 [Acidimicrobiia bacterium]|nr:hypothetical protein [Acidimicrobiia bacterium]